MRSSARGCSPLVRSETTQKQPDAASGCSASQSATTGGTRIEVAPLQGTCLVLSTNTENIVPLPDRRKCDIDQLIKIVLLVYVVKFCCSSVLYQIFRELCSAIR